MADEPIIECCGIDVGYGAQPVLRGVELRVFRGEIVTIFGGSGSGKSTLLRAIVGLLPPRRGTIRLFGSDLYTIGNRERLELLERVGMLFQNGALLGSLSVLDNVMLPLRELTRLPEAIAAEMASSRLALVGLSGTEYQRPTELSGGQRKRAALARASILDPEIIFCDEPTSGLDPVISGTVDDILLRFRETLGVTVVAITHDMASVQAISDRGIMLGNGHVLAEGSIPELMHSREPSVHAFFSRFSSPGTSQASSQRRVE